MWARANSLVMWNRTYTVPNRFGIRSILIATLLFAVVFTLTKMIDASLRVVAPAMSFVLLIGLAQMLFGSVPRRACVSVGASLFPACAWIDPLFDGRMRIQSIAGIDLFWLFVCGGIAGYLGGVLLAGMFLVADQLRTLRGRSVYAVPRQFGTGTLLLATTLFAVLFAVLKWAGATPQQLFFCSAFVATVSLAQIVFERAPRWASMLAGGVYLPLSMLNIPVFYRRPIQDTSFSNVFRLVLIGLCIGYLGGAIIAGIFLAMDYVAKLGQRREPMTKPQ